VCRRRSAIGVNCNAELPARQSMASGSDTLEDRVPFAGHTDANETMRSGSAKASGLKSTASATVNTAVLAPMPGDKRSTARIEDPGFFRR
jgi:hypothetical protein